jgi:DNA-binding NarL/FixJ family response regulator
MKKITVMVVDDHPAFREGLASLLREEPDIEVVGTLEDGWQALDTAGGLHPEIALMDISMPRLNGIEAARQIREISPHTAVLMLSAFDYPSYILASLRVGAAGYLSKDMPLDRIVSAIRMVHSGGSVFDLKVAGKILNQMASGKAETGSGLQPRELQILHLAAQGRTNREIGSQLSISERTVQTHLVKIFRKLGVKSRTEAILKALKEGWIDMEDLASSTD